jgi:hypothetical protein
MSEPQSFYTAPITEEGRQSEAEMWAGIEARHAQASPHPALIAKEQRAAEEAASAGLAAAHQRAVLREAVEAAHRAAKEVIEWRALITRADEVVGEAAAELEAVKKHEAFRTEAEARHRAAIQARDEIAGDLAGADTRLTVSIRELNTAALRVFETVIHDLAGRIEILEAEADALRASFEASHIAATTIARQKGLPAPSFSRRVRRVAGGRPDPALHTSPVRIDHSARWSAFFTALKENDQAVIDLGIETDPLARGAGNAGEREKPAPGRG